MMVGLGGPEARVAPITDFLSELHHQLGDVGYAILASVVLLVCLAVVIAIIIYFELYSG